MKTILTFTILSVFFSAKPDSERIVEKSVQIKEGQTLDLKFDFAEEIKVSTWDKQEVFVKATVNINDNTDNDDFSLKIDNSTDVIKIVSNFNNRNEKPKHNFTTELIYEVKIPNNIKLNINSISGNIITAGFDKQMDIKTISGFIDVTYPAIGSANFKAKTVSGEIFTNHELEMGKVKDSHTLVPQTIDAKLNGGSNKINLNTISGNIYLRK